MIIPNNEVLKSVVTSFVVQLQSKAFKTHRFLPAHPPEETPLKDRPGQLVFHRAFSRVFKLLKSRTGDVEPVSRM